jgi:hypothetical protein
MLGRSDGQLGGSAASIADKNNSSFHAANFAGVQMQGAGYLMNDGGAKTSIGGLLGAVWAVGGLAVILLDAINRLSGMAMHALDSGLTAGQYVVLLLVVIAMAYAEGYRGFQKSFSPRCAARAYYLYRHPDTLSVLLAPLFIMGFFKATRKPLLFAWVGTALIIMLIVALQLSPQPWRGIVDAGVVVGLSWGLISFLVATYRVFTGRIDVSPEVPGESTTVSV